MAFTRRFEADENVCPTVGLVVRGRNRRAFTLVESLVATVIVGMLLVAALSVAATGTRARRAQRDMNRGEVLAQQLLSQAVQNPYATIVTTNPESPPVDLNGSPIAGFAGWSRSVVVDYVSLNGGALVTGSTDMGLKRITVTVTSPLGKTWTATALRFVNGLYDKSLSGPAVYTSWIGVTVQVGDNPTTSAAGGANLLNQAP